MFSKIKNKVDEELKSFSLRIKKEHSLHLISPLLYNSIKDYVLRPGKRIRPSLFVVGYNGFSKKSAKNLYRASIAFELLHDFMLVHDDIIDKSELRRGKPAMHTMFNDYLKKTKVKDLKFNGQDLAIVAGDAIYALAIKEFNSVKVNSENKEKALNKFTDTAFYTGCGEFIEILYGIKTISQLTKKDIYSIYDLKTALYTFSFPLATGAILAGAKSLQVQILIDYGKCLGRAFQIKDDILGMFGEEKEIGKSALSDLQEAKKTIIIWHAHKFSSGKNKKEIDEILNKKSINFSDLKNMRKLIESAGTLKYLKKEVLTLRKKAESLLLNSKIKSNYKKELSFLTEKILKL